MSMFVRLPPSAPAETITNELPNPSFETDITGWAAVTSASSLGQFARPDADELSGNWCFRWTSGGTVTSVRATQEIPCTPGETIRAQFQGRSDSGAGTMQGSIRFYDSSDVEVGTATWSPAGVVLTTTGWQDVDVAAVTVPATTEYARLDVRVTSSSTTRRYLIDNAIVYKGTTVVDYFDGDTGLTVGDGVASLAAWNGTEHASTSELQILGVLSTSVDGDIVIPDVVIAPYEDEREVRNIARELMHSSEVRGVFVPTALRAGEYTCGFSSYGEADTARSYFAGAATFIFSDPEAGIEKEFMVHGGTLGITQRPVEDQWNLRVPFKELST